MQYTKESKIETINDVRKFFGHLVNERRLTFHPDDNFEDYVSEDGANTFSEEECTIYNRLMDESFEVCDKNSADIYAIGLEYMKSTKMD